MENKIDEFITTLQTYDSWYDMLPEIRKFQKETGFELSKTKLIASYRRLELNNPKFFQALLKKKVRGQSGVSYNIYLSKTRIHRQKWQA